MTDGETVADIITLKGFYKPMMQNNPRYAIGTWDEASRSKFSTILLLAPSLSWST